MKLIAEYLDIAIKFECLAAVEPPSKLKESFEKQAAAYRNSAYRNRLVRSAMYLFASGRMRAEGPPRAIVLNRTATAPQTVQPWPGSRRPESGMAKAYPKCAPSPG
jgi:hypothetical protein